MISSCRYSNVDDQAIFLDVTIPTPHYSHEFIGILDRLVYHSNHIHLFCDINGKLDYQYRNTLRTRNFHDLHENNDKVRHISNF